MNINVPDWAMQHFGDEPPAGSMEFWSFRFQPPCMVGDTLFFRSRGKIIARATVELIEQPWLSKCDGSSRFHSGWKVFWTPESFVDMRQEHGETVPLSPTPPARPVQPSLFPNPPARVRHL